MPKRNTPGLSMLPGRNTPSDGLMSLGWVMIGLLLSLLAILPATAANQPPSEAPLTDSSHAQQVYSQVEQWIKTASVPATAEPLWVSDCAGIRLTIRWLAMPLGSGQVWQWTSKDKPMGTRQAVNLSELARQAAVQAIQQAHVTLKEATPTGDDTKKNKPRTVRDLAPVLTLELEIARQPQAISLSSGAPNEALFDQWVWGWHGLIMQRDAEASSAPRLAWLWPGEILTNNMQPQGQIARLLADVGGTLKDQPRLARPSGWFTSGQSIPMWRFQTLHLVRHQPGQPLTSLVRGNRLLPPAAANGTTIESLAWRLTTHLIQKTQQDGQVSGNYLPAADRYDPAVANDPDTALVACALAWRARHLQSTQPDHAQLKAVSQASRRIAVQLADRLATATANSVDDPATACLLLMALTQGPELADQKPARDRLVHRLLLQQQADGLFRIGAGEKPQIAPLPTQSLILAGLTMTYQQTRQPHLAAAIERSRQAIWKAAQPDKMLALMPWLALSERALRQMEEPSADASWRQQRQARSVAMLTFNDLLSGRQIRQTSDDWPADMIGGIDFSPLPTAGQTHVPQPDWHTAQALSFWAVFLSQRDITPANQTTLGLINAGLAARYLAQMTFDDAGCYFVRSRSDAQGGMRLALWDNRLGPAPNAMALLSLTLLQQTLIQIESEQSMASR